MKENKISTDTKSLSNKLKYLIKPLLIIGLIVFVVQMYGYYFNLYIATPEYIREPLNAHHHFRMQLIIEGKQIDFSQNRFQEPYNKNNCSADLTQTPIHFHDNVDQIVHIHWSGITGGQVLKYYGLNYINGNNKSLGYRIVDGQYFSKEVRIKDKLHEESEEINKNSKLWVYTGDENSYTMRSRRDFLYQDLEDFFGKKSKLTRNREILSYNITNILLPKAYAHENTDENHSNQETKTVEIEMNYKQTDKTIITSSDEGPSQNELEDIQDLIGNVVIFVQEDRPEVEEIRSRFNNLTPLTPSSCGG